MLLAWYLVHRNRSGINHLTQLSDKEQNSFFFFLYISQLELTNKVFLVGYLVSAFSTHILTALLFWKTSPQPSHWMLNELVCMFCVELFCWFPFVEVLTIRFIVGAAGGKRLIDLWKCILRLWYFSGCFINTNTDSNNDHSNIYWWILRIINTRQESSTHGEI